MAEKIKISDLSGSINDILKDYKEYCENITYEDIDKTGDAARKKVKELAPVAASAYKKWEPDAEEIRPGTYKKSWRKKTEGKGTAKPSVVVYAGGNQYRLTHLLENGHAKKGGGRVRGYSHIAPAQELAEDEVMRALEKHLGGG